MADLERGVKIHELTTASTVSSSDYVAIDDGDNTYKVSIANLNTTGATTASHYAELAEASATAAQSSATTATTAAQSASSAVTLATSQLQSYVTDAETAASNAAISEANARAYASSDYVKQARSWAVGGTESREGEDTDNSKYYSENAANSAINAATSATDANTENLKAEGHAVGQQNGVDVDSSSPYYHNNAKYYSEIAQGAGAGGVNSSVIAPAEVTSIATRAYSVGDQFVYNGVLYKATSPISIGSTIVPGTNCTIADNLVYQIGEKQNIVLASTMTIGGQTITEVEPALHALNNKNSGHIIYDEDGVSYPERGKLKFVNCEITDDSTNDMTIIEAEGGGGTSIVAVVSITTNSSALYGATITVKNGGSSVGTTTFSNSGTATYTANAIGIYTFECTYSGETYTSDSVVISASGSYSASIYITPTGSTVTPTDDIQTWLNCASIFDKNYTTLSAVLADSTTLAALMLSHNAVDYLVRSTTWASDICADSTAMTDIGADDYCADTLLADSTWRTAICDSQYFESVLTTKVPTMTSNTAPRGVVSVESYYQSFYGYNAFDNDNTTLWNSDAHIPTWIQYDFGSAVTVYKSYLIRSSNYIKKYIIKGSNDGNNFDNLFTSETLSNSSSDKTFTDILTTVGAYRYYRFYISEAYASAAAIQTLQFYGRASS